MTGNPAAPSPQPPPVEPGRRATAKILVAGGAGTGKTTFIGSVSDIDPVGTEVPVVGTAGPSRFEQRPAPTTTAALDYGRLAFDDLTVLLFGTPAPGRLPFLDDDLARGALGAVILVEPRRVSDSYPAMALAERHDLPYVVAVNATTDPDRLADALRVAPQVPVCVCDAADRASSKGVLTSLFRIVLRRHHARPATDRPDPIAAPPTRLSSVLDQRPARRTTTPSARTPATTET